MELYGRYAQAMYSTASRMLNDSMEAEDAMQEAFIKAFAKLDSFKGEVAFGAWLKRIVVNECLQLLRKKNLETISDENLIYNSLKNKSEDLYDEDEQQEKWKKVRLALEKLNERYRLVLTLFLIEGYDYEEIGEIMRLSEGNCRTLISRAKEKLKEELQKLK